LVSLALINRFRFLFPLWQKLTSLPPTVFPRIGEGHHLSEPGMTVSAIVESLRLTNVNSSTGEMWQFPHLILVRMDEAFHLPRHFFVLLLQRT